MQSRCFLDTETVHGHHPRTDPPPHPLHTHAGTDHVCAVGTKPDQELFPEVTHRMHTSDLRFNLLEFRVKLKKVGKTTRPFRYDLNQIPYDYTVEVTNRFKGLDLIDRVPEELWTEVCETVQEAVIKIIPRKRHAKRQNRCQGRPYK